MPLAKHAAALISPADRSRRRKTAHARALAGSWPPRTPSHLRACEQVRQVKPQPLRLRRRRESGWPLPDQWIDRTHRRNVTAQQMTSPSIRGPTRVRDDGAQVESDGRFHHSSSGIPANLLPDTCPRSATRRPCASLIGRIRMVERRLSLAHSRIKSERGVLCVGRARLYGKARLLAADGRAGEPAYKGRDCRPARTGGRSRC
jgi:hypothetical protein